MRKAMSVIADHFALAGTQPGADRNAERLDFVGARASAAPAGPSKVARTPSLVALIS
jgi:hypothetical protein